MKCKNKQIRSWQEQDLISGGEKTLVRAIFKEDLNLKCRQALIEIMEKGKDKMTLRTFRDFSVEEQGYVDESGEHDQYRMNDERLETYPLSEGLYVFDYSERLEKAIEGGRFFAGRDNIDPFSQRSKVYRIISHSEKARTAIGVEIKNPDKKKSLVNRVKDFITKSNERVAWEICQGWHRRE